MAKIEWDKTGDKFYELGVDHGVLYRQKLNAKSFTTGAEGYENGVAWNGLTGVTESPDGAEPNDLYADNIKYASIRSAETFGATIEAYTYPKEFAVCDGSAELQTGIYIGQQSRRPFSFCYRTKIGNDTTTEEDDGYKLHIVYNATASPSERSYETINDSPDAITFSWEITTTPVSVTGHKPTSVVIIDTTKLDDLGKANLAKLEDKLYGTDTTEPTLLMPDEIKDLMSQTAEIPVNPNP